MSKPMTMLQPHLFSIRPGVVIEKRPGFFQVLTVFAMTMKLDEGVEDGRYVPRPLRVPNINRVS